MNLDNLTEREKQILTLAGLYRSCLEKYSIALTQLAESTGGGFVPLPERTLVDQVAIDFWEKWGAEHG